MARKKPVRSKLPVEVRVDESAVPSKLTEAVAALALERARRCLERLLSDEADACGPLPSKEIQHGKEEADSGESRPR